MGWGRMLLLGDFGQQMDLDDLSNAVNEMRRVIQSGHGNDQRQDAQIAALQRENDELKLYVAGLVQLLTRNGVISANEIERLVTAVDPGA